MMPSFCSCIFHSRENNAQKKSSWNSASCVHRKRDPFFPRFVGKWRKGPSMKEIVTTPFAFTFFFFYLEPPVLCPVCAPNARQLPRSDCAQQLKKNINREAACRIMRMKKTLAFAKSDLSLEWTASERKASDYCSNGIESFRLKTWLGLKLPKQSKKLSWFFLEVFKHIIQQGSWNASPWTKTCQKATCQKEKGKKDIERDSK